jgi:hypothetical protein
MDRQKKIVIPTVFAAVLTGVVIWAVAGSPPHPGKPFTAHQVAKLTR